MTDAAKRRRGNPGRRKLGPVQPPPPPSVSENQLWWRM